MHQRVTTPTPQSRRGSKRSGEVSPVAAAGPCNVRTMSVKQLESYFMELAPVARYYCDKNYQELLSEKCRDVMTRYRHKAMRKSDPAGTASSLPLDTTTTENNNISIALTSVWLFAREHVKRFPQLRDTPTYLAYAKDAEDILDKWLVSTNALVDRLQAQGVQNVYDGIDYVQPPLPETWARAHAMLRAVLEHASHHGVSPEMKLFCQSLAQCFSPTAPTFLTYEWLQCTQGLASFRYVLKCEGGRFLDAQWSTGTWSRVGHAWHPEMSGLSLLVLKDLAIPLPWRGLGFSRLLRELECILALTSGTTGVHGLFLHHVHRDMLSLTLAKGQHGYRFWADPCARATQDDGAADDDDVPFREALGTRAAEAIQSGTDRHAKPWMYAFTEHYGAAPVYGEIFHVPWLTPLGERLAAAQIRPAHRVLVPLGILESPLKQAAVFIGAYIANLEDGTKSQWQSFRLEHPTSENDNDANDDGDHAAQGEWTTSIRLRTSRAALSDNEPWALTVHVIPVQGRHSGSMLEAQAYTTFLAFVREFVQCLCGMFVYASRPLVLQPPVLIQLMVRFTDNQVEHESAELGADLQGLFGNDFVCARQTDRRGVAAYLIHNRQVRTLPLGASL